MPDGSTLNFIKFPGPNGQLLELQVIGLLHSSICVRGRAGRIYLVLYEGRRCILKDAWVDITRNFEGDILAQCGNAYGLPRFLAQSKFGYDTTYPDVVPSHRYQDRFSRETRERVRILMATYGRPLSEYRSNPIKLLWAIYSAILGHWYLLKKGYLHRDVSNTNILVLDEPQPYDPIPEHIIPSALINPASSCTGVLIDVDMALKVDNSGKRKLEDPPKEKRTGATAFMSINMVFKIDAIPGPPQQTFYDDLESFFWVIVWVAFGIAIKSDRDIGKSEQRLWNASIEKAVRQNISNTTIDALGGNVGKSALTFSTFWETKVCFDPSSQPYVGVCRSLASLLFDSGRYTVPFRRSNQDLAYTRVLHAILEAIIELSKDQTTG
ncbi:hypothetical protein SISSUDRAFT_564950 [Sistotremastrum suecicum HHB10207 ss-3]|uniref:Fungal-type protein kinase domain-containing protein n=1 Tax=Sistotremastrum suecicum HHB10207 ss-3 TaxID=1314776 RepID=A0A166ETW6_9AGAM|nr:hypothetical protein SISSUDRAFT_564950 [Sistotremastrum suecicum HHB10207 ss-3]